MIVFIQHGLGSSPRKLINIIEQFKNYKVICPHIKVEDFRKGLEHCANISHMYIKDNTEPILFIGVSIGGLIIRKLLENVKYTYRAIFIASPLLGLTSTNPIFDIFKRLYLNNYGQTQEDLNTNSDFIKSLKELEYQNIILIYNELNDIQCPPYTSGLVDLPIECYRYPVRIKRATSHKILSCRKIPDEILYGTSFINDLSSERGN